VRLSSRFAALSFTLALAAAFAGAAAAQDAAQLFVSPMGEPFRAPEGKPYPSADWFAKADANHDGVLTRQEFRADALRFFKVLDANGDGRISDFEIQRYEYILAPEIVAASSDTSDFSIPKAEDDPGYKNTPLSPVKQGAANFSFLNDAEPVRSADADLNNKITQDEFLAAADRRFDKLLPEGATELHFADLPLTPVQPLPDKGKKKH
jgi:hypothetical protein